MKAKNNSLIPLLNTAFVVCGEMINGCGEDSFACAVNESYGMIAVFDGCGGIGSCKYPQYENKTGAYIASHTAGAAALQWFEDFSETETMLSNNTVYEICGSIKRYIVGGLAEFEETEDNKIKGSLARRFPTTASVILFDAENKMLNAAFVWAGDSRGFILDSSGLVQITKDDIEDEGDALANLRNDSKLTNLMSADGNGVLNGKIIRNRARGVLITATDGCFGYFRTPMEFEYMILDTLMRSKTINEWKINIVRRIEKYTADDYTIGIAMFGYASLRKLKKSLSKRKKFLYEMYISKLKNASDISVKVTWNKYKKGYYREEV